MEKAIYTWIQVPAGKNGCAACCEGNSLPSQFVPAPFDGSITGSVLTKASKGSMLSLCDNSGKETTEANSNTAGFESGSLYYVFGGKKVLFSDTYQDADKTEFAPSEPALIETFHGSEATVTRVYATVKGMEKAVAYDFVAYKNLPLVQIFVVLNPNNPEVIFPFHITKLTFDKSSAANITAGLPKAEIPARDDLYIAENYVSFTADGMNFALVGGYPAIQTFGDTLTAEGDWQCGVKLYDITEYGPQNPFVTNIVFSKDAIDAESWLEELPSLYAQNDFLDKNQVISVGDLEVILENNGDGLNLLGLADLKNGKALLNRGTNLLFSLNLRHIENKTKLHLSSREGWGNIETTSIQNMHTWIFSGHKEVENISVVLTAWCDPKKSRISWDVSVQNQSEGYSVQDMEYPRLTVNADNGTTLLSPYGSGEIRRRLGSSAAHATLNYPGFGVSFQFGAIYNSDSGLYYGVHDPAPAYKVCNFDKQTFKQTVSFGFTYPFEFIDKAGNSSSLPGKAVWQLFEGDWYDACMIYKEFVDAEANWLPEVDENGPVNTPDWMKTCSHWWRTCLEDPRMEGDYSNWLQDTLDAQKDLGIPCADHVYHWHQTIFDNEYPHFFPARREFIRGASVMQEAGIKLVPYINSRCWDTLDGGTDDWEYTSKALSETTKDLDGNTFIEISPFNKPNGGPKVQLAVMCPSSIMWQDLQCELVDKLYNELGMDGVYLDQIGAAKPNLCADPHHNHAAGGGSWWIDHYHNMVNRLKTHSPKTGALVTECTGEAYMKTIEALLSWAWVRNSQVPAFPALYGGRVAMVGRDYDSLRDEEGMKIYLAESLLFGEQMGWIPPDRYLNSCYHDFYKKCVLTRDAHKKFFYAGKMLRPLSIESDQEPITTFGCIMAEGQIVSAPAVMGGHWQKFTGDQELIVLINLSNNAAKTEIKVPAGIDSLNLTGDLNETVDCTKGTLSLTLPAQAVVTAIINR